jgi:hypothetical protein
VHVCLPGAALTAVACSSGAAKSGDAASFSLGLRRGRIASGRSLYNCLRPNEIPAFVDLISSTAGGKCS